MKHLTQQDSQAPDICLERMRPLVENLRRHILVGSANRVSSVCLRIESARPAEIANFDPVIFPQQQVFGFDIPVNDPPLVEMAHRQGGLVEKSESERLRQPLLRVDVAKEAVSRCKLKQKVDVIVVGAGIVKANYVRMIKRFVEIDFNLEILLILPR